jgi:hypothetical protein
MSREREESLRKLRRPRAFDARQQAGGGGGGGGALGDACPVFFGGH